MSVERGAILAEARAELDRALSVLDAREREIVRLRFGLDGAEPLTLEQAGARFAISRQRVRQIENKALRKLGHPSHRLLAVLESLVDEDAEPQSPPELFPGSGRTIENAERQERMRNAEWHWWFYRRTRLMQRFRRGKGEHLSAMRGPERD